MPRRYKLRLGDGTILAVDQEGLRTWQIDDQAMVQLSGSGTWSPLRDVLGASASYDDSPPVETPTPLADLPVIPFKRLGEDELEELELTEETEALPAPAPLTLPLTQRRDPGAVAVEAGKALMGVAASGLGRLDALARSPRGERLNRRLEQWADVLARRRPRGRRAALAAAVGVVLFLATATAPTWRPLLAWTLWALAPTDLPGVYHRPAPDASLEPRIPEDVHWAAQKLPHLDPLTVQLVMSRSPFPNPDPPEIFRQAHATARRGVSALTEQEADELRALQRAVLGRLRHWERQRVQVYDRLRAGRHLLVGEDARVLALFTRGVRALPPRSRQRLQQLLGKAIEAALAADAGPAVADAPLGAR